jgi:hypothetical protein
VQEQNNDNSHRIISKNNNIVIIMVILIYSVMQVPCISLNRVHALCLIIMSVGMDYKVILLYGMNLKSYTIYRVVINL